MGLGWPCHESYPQAGLRLFGASLFKDDGDCLGGLAKWWASASSRREGAGVTSRGHGVRSQPWHTACSFHLLQGDFLSLTPHAHCSGSRPCVRKEPAPQNSMKITNKCVVLPANA